MPLPTLNAAANSAAYLVAALFVLRVVWFQQQHGRSRRVLLLLIYTLVVVAYPVLPYAVLATRETAPDFTAVWLRPWVLLAAPGFAFLALVTQRYGQQRQREAEMAELQEQMMQKEALLMQNLNHELRTPFALMYGYIELIGDGAMGQLPDKVAQVIAAVRKKLTYARLLLERNLLLLTEDEYQFALSEMSTAELCAEAVADARVLAIEGRRNLTVTLGEISGGEISGDARLLWFMMNNLIANAIKFTPDNGRIEISCRQDGSGSIIAVKDTGIGMEPDKLPRIFERFYQIDGSPTRPYGGVGIGLHFVSYVVSRHNGRITVTSVPGEGSTFEVWLPGAPPEEWV